MKRTGSAVWRGDLKGGSGTVSTQSGTLKDTAYSFVARFENVPSQIYYGAGASALDIYRFGNLSVLKTLLRRTPIDGAMNA